MPYEIFWEERGSFWVYSGLVTAEELISSNEEFLNDERCDSARYQLIDMTQITGIEAGSSAMKMLAATDFGAGHYLRRMRVAMTAVLPEMRELMIDYEHMLNSTGSKWKARLFDNLEEARAWAMAEDTEPPWELPGR